MLGEDTRQSGCGCHVSGVSGSSLKLGLEASALGLGILWQDRFTVCAGSCFSERAHR